ncbi:transcriptional regulator NrdR [Acinetobacter rudis]|uniref:Transcriptional repressor NrdR n=1 Tax=Acinetobacter rudis CIP 110305 TaxID=421052 RepID=S3NT40_9GAMM|nr:transcriptional regulator NrdR [Acinetobacter rudis]EPF81613.1 transcriptional repressor NrdR [Acinetobacter rudis CIP 110305]
MHCPFCNVADSKVIDSRLAASGSQIRRRRECVSCAERFTTFESYEMVMPRVIKSNGKNEPFDEEKLRRSLMHALQKRPITQEQIESALSDIQLQIRRLGERDVKSRLIGEIVMKALFALDHVAYVRFASVYQDFQDVEAFRQQIESMLRRDLND